ncbi:hypothetical protein KDK88_04000, partial [bacterium]|nr:hypothetical protein [bacterium]
MPRTAALLLCLLAALPAAAVETVTDASPALEVEEIMHLIEKVREKPFLESIRAADQSVADFEAYLDRTLDAQIPPELAENYETIMRAVGLYRGEGLGDFKAVSKMVMMSQAAAYYDPETAAFYVVMHDMADSMRRPVYAHELTHGLQDQHFDLNAYLLDHAGGALNDDQLLARQAVVEGEATYVMTIASVVDMLGMTPPREMLGIGIEMQAGMSAKQLSAMVEGSPVLAEMGGDMAAAVEAMDEIPAFLMETLMGSYLKGQAFIHAVQAGGWTAVDALYAKPPVSTEQILHPEKYAAGEVPVRFDLDALDPVLTQGWTRLHANTLGEMQWRVVLEEHGLDDIARDVAAGWDGDAYAVYADAADATLLLLTTHWDTEQDAEEFEAAY